MDKIGKSGSFEEAHFFPVSAPEISPNLSDLIRVLHRCFRYRDVKRDVGEIWWWNDGDSYCFLILAQDNLFNSNKLLSMRILLFLRNTYKGACGISYFHHQRLNGGGGDSIISLTPSTSRSTTDPNLSYKQTRF